MVKKTHNRSLQEFGGYKKKMKQNIAQVEIHIKASIIINANKS